MKQSANLTIILTIALLVACGPVPTPGTPSVHEADPAALITGTHCFRSVTTAGDGAYSDTMSIVLNVSNNTITGRMDWLPGMKDKMRGTLKGTIADERITALYTYSAEGVEFIEERLFQLHENGITILGGELEERDGMWVLKDPANAVEGMTVPEVDC